MGKILGGMGPADGRALVTCVYEDGVFLPLRRGRLCRYEVGSCPTSSVRWLMTRERWPVWRRLPTMMLCRYTGSMKWQSSAPCSPSTFHLQGQGVSAALGWPGGRSVQVPGSLPPHPPGAGCAQPRASSPPCARVAPSSRPKGRAFWAASDRVEWPPAWAAHGSEHLTAVHAADGLCILMNEASFSGK